MRRVREVIVVEGRYDKNTLAQVVEATVIPLGGFSIFHDREKLAYLRWLAAERGVILLTDSDGAGFVIRNYLKGAIPPEQVKQAYIPDVYGKERRKRRAGKEGKLGVEGMGPAVLLEALRRAGATFEDEAGAASAGETAAVQGADSAWETAAVRGGITKADLFAWGLSGGPDSAARRRALLKRLELPEHLTANGLLEALNLLYSRAELERLLEELDGSPEKVGPDDEI